MRHPFDGLVGVGRLPGSEEAPGAGMTRRGALGKMAIAAAGVLGASKQARGQAPTTRALGEEGGAQPTTLAPGEEGGPGLDRGIEELPVVTSWPFGEEAGNVTSRVVPGLEDGSTSQPVVKVKPLGLEVAERQLDGVWAELGSTVPARNRQACAELYGAREGFNYLKNHLDIKVTEPDEKEVAKRILQLDDDEFYAREEAEAGLLKMGPNIKPLIEKALKEHASPEMYVRLNRLLTKLTERNSLRQAECALEVLVALHTPEAGELLRNFARGDDKDWLAQKARKALERLK
jgi:hypothetical protein